MFAGDSQAFLRRGRAGIIAFFLAGEDLLKRDHPGVNKVERRIAMGDQRGRAHPAVLLFLKVFQELFAQLLGADRRRHTPR